MSNSSNKTSLGQQDIAGVEPATLPLEGIRTSCCDIFWLPVTILSALLLTAGVVGQIVAMATDGWSEVKDNSNGEILLSYGPFRICIRGSCDFWGQGVDYSKALHMDAIRAAAAMSILGILVALPCLVCPYMSLVLFMKGQGHERVCDGCVGTMASFAGMCILWDALVWSLWAHDYDSNRDTLGFPCALSYCCALAIMIGGILYNPVFSCCRRRLSSSVP